jgi:hypothetical protein
MDEEYSLVARTRTWVPDWLWKFFCIRFPLVGGLGVIQPFRWILTTPVKPKPEIHPHCIWCEGREHCLHPDCDDETGEVVLRCRHCSYQRSMSETEADADWDNWDAPNR